MHQVTSSKQKKNVTIKAKFIKGEYKKGWTKVAKYGISAKYNK